MNFREIVEADRSYRRFQQSRAIEKSVLEELVNLARISASSANLQPLKYKLSCDADTNARIFPYLNWAGYLTEWVGPEKGERPAAYIVVLGDTEISRHFGYDPGIASQTILLGAAEKGIGGCMIGSLDRRGLADALDISGRYEILLVLAMGVPDETVRLTEATNSIRYYRDEQDEHVVPKRPLSEVIL